MDKMKLNQIGVYRTEHIQKIKFEFYNNTKQLLNCGFVTECLSEKVTNFMHPNFF